jgi:peptidoglycan DL-endopeptidase CwlO
MIGLRGWRLSVGASAAVLIALAAAAAALATSPIAAKQAEAQQVFNEIQGLDQNLGRADELINLANLRIAHVDSEQRINRGELAVARMNLGRSQRMIAQRLVSLYNRPQASPLEMILGATSLSSLLTRIDNADRLSSLDNQVIAQVQTFKAAVQRDASRLASEHAYATNLLAQRRAERISIANQLSYRQQLLVSIKGQIATLEAQAAAEQRRLQQEALQREEAAQAAQRAAAQAQAVGATVAAPASSGQAQQPEQQAQQPEQQAQQPQQQAQQPQQQAQQPEQQPAQPQQQPVAATPSEGAVAAGSAGTSVLPASPYGGQAVQIAMSYLGVPYVWGGASPSGFDCSGLVMYTYAQLGVSLPHSSYAMYNYGIPVPESQLEPGDLVFFDGLGHVGIYIGGGEFVNAPYTGSVVSVSSLTSGWAAANYVGARRIT